MITKSILLGATIAIASLGCGDSKKSSEPKKAAASEAEPAKDPAPVKVDIHLNDDKAHGKGASVSVEAVLEVK